MAESVTAIVATLRATADALEQGTITSRDAALVIDTVASDLDHAWITTTPKGNPNE